jgi:hypothetical protein
VVPVPTLAAAIPILQLPSSTKLSGSSAISSGGRRRNGSMRYHATRSVATTPRGFGLGAQCLGDSCGVVNLQHMSRGYVEAIGPRESPCWALRSSNTSRNNRRYYFFGQLPEHPQLAALFPDAGPTMKYLTPTASTS